MGKWKLIGWVIKHACFNWLEDRRESLRAFGVMALMGAAALILVGAVSVAVGVGAAFFAAAVAGLMGWAGLQARSQAWFKAWPARRRWAAGASAAALAPVALFMAGLLSVGTLSWTVAGHVSENSHRQHAWLPDCEARLKRSDEVARMKGPTISCQRESGRMGVLAGAPGYLSNEDVRRQAEAILGASGLAWEPGRPGKSARAMMEAAGFSAPSRETRWGPARAPWLGEATRWSSEELEEALSSAFFGLVLLGAIGLSIYMVWIACWGASKNALRWLGKHKDTAREWVASAEFLAQSERRMLGRELREKKDAPAPRRSSGRL